MSKIEQDALQLTTPEPDLLGDRLPCRGIVGTLGEFAIELGLTRDEMRPILSRASIAPVGKQSGNPLYRLSDVFKAVTGQQSPERLSPHNELAIAKKILLEDEIRKRRGEVCEATDVERGYSDIWKLVARSFDTAIDNVERDVGLSHKQATRLEQHFDKCREEIYREAIDGKNGNQKAVRQNNGGTQNDSARASRGSKGSKRLRQT